MVVGVPPMVRVMLLAPSVEPAGISGEVHEVPVKFGEVIEKPAAAPGVLETIASRDPEESLTTEAVTPRLDPLMAVAKSLRVSPAVPAPVGMVAVAPPFMVIVSDDVGKVEVGLASRSEYQEPVLA